MRLPSLPWNKFRSGFNSYRKVVRLFALLMLLGVSGYIYYLDVTIREAFEGRKFAVPARVYGRALEVYPELKLISGQFVDELQSN